MQQRPFGQRLGYKLRVANDSSHRLRDSIRQSLSVRHRYGPFGKLWILFNDKAVK